MVLGAAFSVPGRSVAISSESCWTLPPLSLLSTFRLRLLGRLSSSSFYSRTISSVVPRSDIDVKDFSVKNEPVLTYLPGSDERGRLEDALKKCSIQ